MKVAIALLNTMSLDNLYYLSQEVKPNYFNGFRVFLIYLFIKRNYLYVALTVLAGDDRLVNHR